MLPHHTGSHVGSDPGLDLEIRFSRAPKNKRKRKVNSEIILCGYGGSAKKVTESWHQILSFKPLLIYQPEHVVE
ncbi:hypothetical protein KOW79_014630 [Hemibagrus wyckioides]|uniref:Uncharacterized protein n=1 Tax=Hemibagrus wyckioides TaxID=337641 RepID=A0A9D3SF00_9TELE|nr:hypothetical protein KOW79_014630 [Hemibagrus wyckioides]